MISEKQKQKVIELSQQGMSQVEIVKKENISRTKVAEIIKDHKSNNVDLSKKESGQENIDLDPEVLKLKKELAKEQLRRKIREQRQPFEAEKKLKELEKKVDFVEGNYYDSLIFDNTWKCRHCNRRGKLAIEIKCTNCDETAWWGWYPKK